MKNAGLIIIVIGLALTLITSFNFVTKKKVLDMGNLEVRADKKHVLDWSPLVGIVVMVVGAGTYLYGKKAN